MKKGIFFAIIILIIGIGVAAGENVDTNVCCEKTLSGLYCQDISSSQCNSNFRQVPTSCKSTSYCKPGTCFDSSEGTCLDNTPQLVCNANNGTWSEKAPAQCELGCCVLGDQAAFVTLVRCKKLSALLGLQTNYRKDILDEVSCVLEVQQQDKGACVYEFEFEKTCKFTTRAECKEGEFFADKLCSAEELGTNCGPSKKTTCLPGKDEVYFVDTCGNPANIYDASKINDKEYWGNVKDKAESCEANTENANSKNCGNCNYLLGSYCRKSNAESAKPIYGELICSDLNCKKTQNGKSYRHGESWCVYNDKGEVSKGTNAVGSRFYKHICINGKEVLEQCAEYRQQECIEDNIEVAGIKFSEAGCRVNRWQDCTKQDNKEDCENSDKRDCLWKNVPSGMQEGEFGLAIGVSDGVCLPKNPPGLKFWDETSLEHCAQANAQCIVEYEKGLFEDWDVDKNDVCLGSAWEDEHAKVCMNIGDCGPNINWIGQKGSKVSYKKTTRKAK